ncbi:MAG: ABC transporter substrate-binding protein, partial [Alphaproteobacteria bacterium]|nr:ABC transporter substrate-binding protein [Alphaproteobacteria bacterium]
MNKGSSWREWPVHLALTLWVGLGLWVGLAAAPAGAGEVTKLKLTLSFTLDGGAAPYVYAKQTGLFEKAGFSVTIDPSGGSGDAISRVASGTYDVG